MWTPELLLDTGVTDLVDLVKADAFRTRRGKNAHRNRDQTERYIALPDSRSHTPPASSSKLRAELLLRNFCGLMRALSRRYELHFQSFLLAKQMVARLLDTDA